MTSSRQVSLQLRKLEELVQENQTKLLEAWDGYFGS
ncbi:DUF4160 domain-containing protein [Nodularia spumigena CS-591/12]|nr:DUF4160 domain-containing protein [Nodularia spumigena]MDB9304805.1 DUF4160 domain-containing protein [Nodularia spumigena CS-591/12]MDB9349240.1 DUF4160 domain-containing protein [Nodularia spumigena CS-588/01]MDB9352058.1 DUF4160 domain-containing protein [Nodularia spumigena CS-588/05]